MDSPYFKKKISKEVKMANFNFSKDEKLESAAGFCLIT